MGNSSGKIDDVTPPPTEQLSAAIYLDFTGFVGLGAPNSVNRVRHLRLGVGEKITAPDGNESRILVRDTWNTDIVPELEPQAGTISFTRHGSAGSLRPTQTLA